MAMDTFSKRVGNCYELAWRYQFAHHGWTLVHGTINGTLLLSLTTGETMEMGDNPHAWCEKDDLVWEPIHNVHLSRSWFIRIYGAVELASYSAKDAAHRAIVTGNYGSWDEGSERARKKFIEWKEKVGKS